MKKITPELKQQAIKVYEETGLLNKAAQAIDVHPRTLRDEMKRSNVFRKKMLAAKDIHKIVRADMAYEKLFAYADGEFSNGKSDRNQVTALLAILNAFEPGFRGKTTVDHKVSGTVKFRTSIPRPDYKEIEKKEPKKRIVQPMESNLIALTGTGERIHDNDRVN